MQSFKKLMMLALSAFIITSASAGDYEKKYPYVFFGVQAGGQAVLNGYNISDVITGTAGAYVGGQWTPVWGTRLHANGWQGKEGVKDWGTYDFKYITATVDVTANLVSAIRRTDKNAVDFYLLGGLGMNKVWGTEWTPAAEVLGITSEVKNNIAPTFKLGAMMDVNFSKHIALSLEVDAYRHLSHDKYYNVNMSNDWQLTAMMGLKFSFPCKGKKVQEVIIPEPVAVVEEVKEPAREPEVIPATPLVPAEKVRMEEVITFSLRSSNVAESQALITKVADFAKEHPTTKVSVKAYADKATGNSKINKKYSDKRAASVKESLVKAGVDPVRITTESYGDAVQPFTSNDENRCVIVVVE